MGSVTDSFMRIDSFKCLKKVSDSRWIFDRKKKRLDKTTYIRMYCCSLRIWCKVINSIPLQLHLCNLERVLFKTTTKPFYLRGNYLKCIMKGLRELYYYYAFSNPEYNSTFTSYNKTNAFIYEAGVSYNLLHIVTSMHKQIHPPFSV